MAIFNLARWCEQAMRFPLASKASKPLACITRLRERWIARIVPDTRPYGLAYAREKSLRAIFSRLKNAGMTAKEKSLPAVIPAGMREIQSPRMAI
ncbi:MAG: hypothetical protein ACR2P7_00475 [bacterium]